jgi:hypothetical protein
MDYSMYISHATRYTIYHVMIRAIVTIIQIKDNCDAIVPLVWSRFSDMAKLVPICCSKGGIVMDMVLSKLCTLPFTCRY